MQAVQFTEHGGTDVIEYGEYGGIEPTENEVRVEIRAGALNHFDVWTRRGLPGRHLWGHDRRQPRDEYQPDLLEPAPGYRLDDGDTRRG